MFIKKELFTGRYRQSWHLMYVIPAALAFLTYFFMTFIHPPAALAAAVVHAFIAVVVTFFAVSWSLSNHMKTDNEIGNAERRFSMLFNNSREAIFTVDRNLSLVNYNPELLKLSGFNDDELKGKNITELFSSNFNRELKKSIESPDNNYRIFYCDMLKKDKETEKLEISCCRIEQNEECLYFFFARNFQEIKKIEDSLKRSEERFKNMANSLPEAVFELFIENSGRARFRFINDTGLIKWGYSKNDIEKGIYLDDVFTPDSLKLFNKILKKRLEGEISTGNEFTAVSRNKTNFPVQVYSTPIIENKSLKGFMGMCIDVSEKKKLQERISHSEKMEAVGQLAGGVAHDFNNQLASIMGCAEMIREFPYETSSVRDYSESIIKMVRNASNVTEQLLSFARKGKYRTEYLDINRLVFETVSLFRNTVNKNIKISQSLNAGPSGIMGDETQIQNAVINLAINSRDAMPDGGEIKFSTDFVELSQEKCSNMQNEVLPGGYIRISVRDTGPGIEENIRDRIFDPFFTTKEQGKGTGMGLAAVFGTVVSHGGVVEVESEAGKGSVFSLYFPPVSEDDRGENGILCDIPVMGKGKILLVDDDADFRRTASVLIESLGYKVQ
ncbi:MAG: PAS domain S-box protein, partial [Fibrobacterota bacterium]